MMVWLRRRAPAVVGVIGALLVASIFSTAVLTYESFKTNEIHHIETIASNRVLEKKDDEIRALLKQHSASFAAQKKASEAQARYDGDVKILATILAEDQAAVCTAVGASCPPLKLP
jgi:hypothetical protein